MVQEEAPDTEKPESSGSARGFQRTSREGIGRAQSHDEISAYWNTRGLVKEMPQKTPKTRR